MTTEERFDAAHKQIAEMRDEAMAAYRSMRGWGIHDYSWGLPLARAQAFSQALLILEKLAESARKTANSPTGH